MASSISALKVTPAKLKAKSSEFSSQATGVKAITDEMFGVIKQLNGAVWSGTAATAYTSRFNKLDDDCTRMYKMIKEFADDLTDIANEYESAEKANEDTAQALQTDVLKF